LRSSDTTVFKSVPRDGHTHSLYIFLCSHRLVTILTHANFRLTGIACQGTKRIVLVPVFICVPILYGSCPKSVANACIHIFFAWVRIKCMYSWISLVTSSITALKYMIGASVYCTVCITALARISERSGYLCTSGPLLSGSIMFEPLLLFWGGVAISRVFGMIFIIKCIRDGGGMRTDALRLCQQRGREHRESF